MLKKHLSRSHYLLAAVVVLLVAFGFEYGDKLGLGFFHLQPELTVKAVKMVNGKEVPQAGATVNLYAQEDHLVKTYIRTRDDGTATFNGIDYDEFYFIGFANSGSGVFGDIFSDRENCGKVITFKNEGTKIYKYVDHVRQNAVKNYTLYPVEYSKDCVAASAAPAVKTITLNAVLSGNKVVATWDNASDAAYYNLYKGESMRSMESIYTLGANAGLAKKYEDSQISKGHTYYYQVQTVNDKNQLVAKSDIKPVPYEVVKNTAPETPKAVYPANGAKDVALNGVLQWSMPKDATPTSQEKLNYKWKITDITGRRFIVWDRGWTEDDTLVGEKDKNCKSLKENPQAWTCSWVKIPDGVLQPGRTYSWTVQAGDGELPSGWSQDSKFTTKQATLKTADFISPEAPKDGAVVELPLQLQWNYNGYLSLNYEWKIVDNKTGKTAYEVTWHDSSKFNMTDSDTNCAKYNKSGPWIWTCEHATIPAGALPAGNYTWYVEAGDGVNPYGYAKMGTFTVIEPTQTITLTKVSEGDRQVRLKWTNNAKDAELLSYKIYRSEKSGERGKAVIYMSRNSYTVADGAVSNFKTYYYTVTSCESDKANTKNTYCAEDAYELGYSNQIQARPGPVTDLSVNSFSAKFEDNKLKLFVQFENPLQVPAETAVYVKGQKVTTTPAGNSNYANYQAPKSTYCKTNYDYVEVKASIDPSNTVKETNELNNEKKFVFSCANPSIVTEIKGEQCSYGWDPLGCGQY